MRLREKKGITGIDITISITLIAIFIALIATITFGIQKKSEDVQRDSDATLYAVQIIEEIKAKGFDILPDAGTHSIEGYDSGYILDSEGKETPYYQEVTVRDYTEIPGNEEKIKDLVKEVTVKVRYKSGSEEKQVELSTIISKES